MLITYLSHYDPDVFYSEVQPELLKVNPSQTFDLRYYVYSNRPAEYPWVTISWELTEAGVPRLLSMERIFTRLAAKGLIIFHREDGGEADKVLLLFKARGFSLGSELV